MDTNQIKTILLFPVKDAYARQQFLIACLIMLAGMVIPIVPIFFLMGYGARIARQIVLEKKEPAMTEWDNWSELFLDGARLFGIRLLLVLPVVFLALFAQGTIVFSSFFIGGDTAQNFSPLARITMIMGMAIIMLAFLLAIPLGFILMAVETHVAVKGSFTAGLQFKEWWPILKNGIGRFLMAYVVIVLASFAFSFIVGFAMMTIVLICLLPFIIFPSSAYFMLINQALYAQAYASSQITLQVTTD